MMLLARAAMIPCRAMSSTLALATRAGTGVSRFSSAIGVTMGSPNAVDEPAGEGGGGLHRHLLPEDRAQSHLESVEGARHPQAGVRLDRRRQTRVFAETFRDDVGPRIEIEQRPHAAEQRRQHRRQAVRELDQQRVLFLRLRHADPALRLAELHGPGIRAVRHVLDACQRARREKRRGLPPSRTADDTRAARLRSRSPRSRLRHRSPSCADASAASHTAC